MAPGSKYSRSLLFISSLASLLVCLSVQAQELDNDLYTQVYPTHIEYCGTTQILQKPGFAYQVVGARWGHAITYIHGLCRDKNSPYPKVYVCDGTEPEQGVGISVDSDFSNVNWVAVESRHFLLFGDLADGETLNQASFDRTVAKAHTMEILQNLDVHQDVFDKAPKGLSHDAVEFDDTFGTEYGVRLGHYSYCTRVPIEKESLQAIADYLNPLNDYYFHGHEFDWSLLSNNCSLAGYNILASTGFWNKLNTDEFAPLEIFNITLPINVFIDAMRRGNDLQLDDPIAVYKDSVARESLLKNHRLPVQPGVLGEYRPIYANNEVFQKDGLEQFIFDLPPLNPNHHDLDHFTNDAKYTDIRANLLWYKNRFEAVAADETSADDYLEEGDTNQFREIDDEDAFRSFLEIYRNYAREEIATIDQKLSLLSAGK